METIQREAIISFPMLGNFSINPPSYFTVFGKTIYFYAVLIAIGFLLGIWYCTRHSKDFGITEDDFYDTVLWLIPISIVGARLYFVAFRLDEYLTHPEKIIAVWEGGLAIYGGVIAGILVLWLCCRKKKIPMAAMLDLFIFGLLIGQILGRWGNFMNREAFGGETEIFCRMGLTSPSGNTVYVHPTFLYESLWNFACLIFLIIWTKKGKRRYDGQCTLIYFFWYGIGRAWIEGLRTDSLYIGSTNIRVSQVLSMVFAVTAGVILLIQSRKQHPAEKLYVNIVKAAECEKEADAEKTEETAVNEVKEEIETNKTEE